MLTIDPTTTLAFSLFENKGVYALLLGSGLSRGAQIPTGWKITLDLIRRVAALEGVPEQRPDWAVWDRQQKGREPDYSEMLDARRFRQKNGVRSCTPTSSQRTRTLARAEKVLYQGSSRDSLVGA